MEEILLDLVIIVESKVVIWLKMGGFPRFGNNYGK